MTLLHVDQRKVVMHRNSSRLARRLSLLSLLPATIAFGQTNAHRNGRRALLPRDSEVALARSAAPPSISNGARVLVLTDTGYSVAESGTTSVTCIVSRSWPESLEPQCFDEEASATVLPIELKRVVLYHEGRSESDVERVIADGLRTGVFRMPRRPAMTFMMSAGQRLVDDNGTMVGAWRPHIMIYYPYLTNRDVGLPATPDMAVGMVSEEGSAMSSLTIAMAHFVPVARRGP